MKTVSVLGATGSVGTNTVSVLTANRDRFQVEAVTANTEAVKLAKVARDLGAQLAVVAEPTAFGELREALSGSGIESAAGPHAVIEAARRPADVVVAAIVGSAGLAPTHAAIAESRTVALANKECLVSAGEVFRRTMSVSGATLLPVDSEHNAIFRILDGRDTDEVARIILTASGGPFRRWTRQEMAAAKPSDALKHPNWSMGAKITIDSATMMNKGLEVIEAFHVFGVSSDRLDVLVHPESIVHGLVEFKDGAHMAALGHPDMRGPIAHCLAWPERAPSADHSLDLAELGRLTFEELDCERFPAFRVAMEALDAGGWATNILSAANEIAVGAFLAGRIGFLEIADLTAEAIAMAASDNKLRTPMTIEEALDIDARGRRLASDLVGSRSAA